MFNDLHSSFNCFKCRITANTSETFLFSAITISFAFFHSLVNDMWVKLVKKFSFHCRVYAIFSSFITDFRFRALKFTLRCASLDFNLLLIRSMRVLIINLNFRDIVGLFLKFNTWRICVTVAFIITILSYLAGAIGCWSLGERMTRTSMEMKNFLASTWDTL